MSDRKIIPVVQEERIKRTFWISVPEDMTDERIEELFFAHNIAGECEHHGERYNVELQIGILTDTRPSEITPIEIDEDADSE